MDAKQDVFFVLGRNYILPKSVFGALMLFWQ